METVNCPYCECSDRAEWARENGFVAWRCGSCGFVYVSPRPTGAEREAAIRLGAHPGALNTGEPRKLRKIWRYRKLLRSMLGHVSEPVRWLDIGSGNGEVLEALSTILPPGSELYGVEPQEQKRRGAQARVNARFFATLEDVPVAATHISLFNVFSHIADFRSFLQQVRRLGTAGHHIFIETGNGADIRAEQHCAKLDLPDHLAFAGERHLKGYLEAHYEIAELRMCRPPVTSSIRDLFRHAGQDKTAFFTPLVSPFRSMVCHARAVGPIS